jgi:hypothetical protein
MAFTRGDRGCPSAILLFQRDLRTG